MTTQHTPGPWETVHNVYGHSRYGVMHENGNLIAEVCDWPDEATDNANARLIAAAPELLEACIAALADTLKPLHLQEPNIIVPQLKAAIAKVRGEAMETQE